MAQPKALLVGASPLVTTKVVMRPPLPSSIGGGENSPLTTILSMNPFTPIVHERTGKTALFRGGSGATSHLHLSSRRIKVAPGYGAIDLVGSRRPVFIIGRTTTVCGLGPPSIQTEVGNPPWTHGLDGGQQHPSTIGHVAIEGLSWQAIIAIPIQPINPITGIWALLKNRNTIKSRMVLSPTDQRGAVVGAVRFPIADFAGIDDAIAAMGERTVTATGIGHVIIV